MKVRIEFSGKKYDPGDEYQESCEIFINGERVARGMNLSESPEDANMGRDLMFVYDIPDLLKAAYEAGQLGEGFTIVEVEDAE